MAWLGGEIVSDVRKGENAGHTLRHNFVALQLVSTTLQRGDAGVSTATVVVPARDDVTARRHALAVWVTPHDQPTPLQAVGGWLE